jgi:hypothetical protein
LYDAELSVAEAIRPPNPPKPRLARNTSHEKLPTPQQVCIFAAVAALLLGRSFLGYEPNDLYHLLAALLNKTWNDDPSLLTGLSEGWSIPETLDGLGLVSVLTQILKTNYTHLNSAHTIKVTLHPT